MGEVEEEPETPDLLEQDAAAAQYREERDVLRNKMRDADMKIWGLQKFVAKAEIKFAEQQDCLVSANDENGRLLAELEGYRTKNAHSLKAQLLSAISKVPCKGKSNASIKPE